MSKRLDKISKIDEQIAKLENQRKLERQKQKDEERKAKSQRYCKRGAVIEKLLPELTAITDVQFDVFAEKVLATNHAKNVLVELVAKNITTESSTNNSHANENAQTKTD